MIRIGNDIVDLTDPQNTGKSRDTRFVNRVFTPRERGLISRAENQDALLWALWAGKETAFKLVSKHDPSATSVPRSYNVSLDCVEESLGPCPADKSIKGSVETPYGKVEIRVFITSDYVHCIGSMSSPDDMDSFVWHVDRISPDPEASTDCESAFVRQALKMRLSTFCDESPEDIEIRRVNGSCGLGPPFVLINGKKAAIDISLSHDGAFAAYAFAMTGSGACDRSYL